MGKQRISHWVSLVVAAVLATSLAGCGGDDGSAGPAGPAGADGAAGPAGPAGPAGSSGGSSVSVGSNALTNTSAITSNANAWADMEPTVTVTGVTIASPPVVTFSVADGFGRPVTGLGNKSKSSTATVASYGNLSFALAKLVPGSAGAPSKWVSYIVTTVPTTTAAAAPTRPSTDNTGTLVDNGDGTYKYTFYRDVTTIKSQVAAMTVTAPNNTADLGDLTYNAALTHRLTIALSGNAPGTGTNTPTGATSSVAAVPMRHPVNAIYDFIPSTGAKVTSTDFSREIVANTNCEACHRKLGGIPGLSEDEDSAGFHGGSRNNVQYCVVCHTDQRRYGQVEATSTANGAVRTFTSDTRIVDGRAVGNLPNLIHKAHLGPLLVNQNYSYAGVLVNETTYPQDVRNCTTCHAGSTANVPARITKTKDGDAWKTNASALACGACHDGINFAAGTGVTLKDRAAGLTTSTIAHPAGPQPDDSLCSVCHKSTGTFPLADIDLSHFPVTPPNSGNALIVTGGNANTNAAWIASGGSVGRLPTGAIAPRYDVKSVSRNASKQPVMVFRWVQNCTATDVTTCTRKDINVLATAAVNPATGNKEMWDNFMGAPSAYFVFAVPQDGITAPADFNVSASGWLRKIWDGTATGTGAGTLTGPDASGYYTVTLTGVTVPDNAVMLTGGMGYTYNVTSTLPLTQTNLSDYPVTAATASGQTNKQGGLIVIAPNVQKVATGYTGRRAIVDDAKCNACHQELGTFTEDAFHAGQRNDGTTCSWCHRPNQTSSGWSADSTAFVHAIHASEKRQTQYTWHASSTTEGFWDVTYPGILNDCQTCHLPGTFDFSATASASAVGQVDGIDKRLYRTVATGKFTKTVGGTYTTYSGATCATTGTTAPQTAAGAFALSPWITADASGATGTNYGVGYTFNAGLTTVTGCSPVGVPYSIAAGGTLAAGPESLVTSPTVTVCSACHDSADAISHFKINGGAYYQARSTAITGSNETCLVCHGTGRVADIAVMHSKNR